jgi:hypothetical protein
MNTTASEVERAAKDLWRIAQDLREGRCSPLEALARIGRATIEAQSAAVEAAERAYESARRCPNAGACPVSLSPTQRRANVVALQMLAEVG